MRANKRFAWSAVSVALLAGGARALPSPPYAATPDGSAAADTLDRYGGQVWGRVASPSPAEPRPTGSARLLSWSGKDAVQPALSAPVPSASLARPPSGLWRPPPTGARATIYDASQKAPPTASAGAAQANALPPPPTQSARRQADGGPRFYSVHRDYGIEPDAIPLAPQFFGPTADLSAPASDPLVKRVTSANGQTRTVDVASGDQTSP